MRARFPFLLAVLAGVARPTIASAQLWDGGGANDSWTTANNWNPNGTPLNDGTANVGFRGTVRLAPVVNTTIDVRSITFASPAGPFDINPGGFRSFLLIGAGGVVNNDDSTQSISNPIRLTAAQTWRAAAGDLVFGAVDGQGNALTINGAFDTTIGRHTGAASSLIKSGSGTLFLTGNATSDGGISVNSGTLSIDAGPRLGANDVVINGGTLAAAADITTLHNITLTAAGASLNAAAHQLSLDGGALTVNGGAVSSASGFVGLSMPSNAAVVLNGDASSWMMTGGLAIGYQDQGTLSVQAGGDLSDSLAHIGSLPGSAGVATVSGSGSTWTTSGFLGVGYSGTGTLNIEAGGSVAADSCFVGVEPGSAGHVAVAGASWSVAGSPVIGEHGVGTMTISDGGVVTDNGAFIGRFSDGVGSVTVTGPGSTWTTNGALAIASSGAGTLTVQDGGLVACTGGCMIGGNPGADGAVTVSAATLAAGSLSVGFVGVGTMDVGPGGSVTSIDGGAGSLTIQNQGRVSNVHATVGRLLHGRGTALVSGAGSTWTGDSLAVGYLSGDGSLTVQNGAHVVCQNGSVGNSSGDGSATVTGDGSAWDIPGALSIGFLASGTLVLDQGGRMSTALLSLGFGSGSNAAAIITGESSSWTIGFEIQLGNDGGTGTLTIAGGTVNVGGNISDGGVGLSTLTLDGGTLDMQNHAIGPGSPIDVLNFRSGMLRNVAGLNSGAGLSKTGPGTLTLNTANTYSGSTDINAGVLQVSNASGSATGPGTVRVAAGAVLGGSGRIAGPVQNSGAVAPGASPGVLRLAATYVQNAQASLNIEIGGVAAGSQYDRLAVTGAAALNGALNVALINGFTPAVGDAFDILTAGSTSGAFVAVNLPPLASGAWTIEYLPTLVRLSVAGCPADFNGDGFLDFFDYDDFVACFETATCPPGRTADFNGDDFADFFDYDEFVAAFETGC